MQGSSGGRKGICRRWPIWLDAPGWVHIEDFVLLGDCFRCPPGRPGSSPAGPWLQSGSNLAGMPTPGRSSLLAVCTLPPWPVRDGYALRVAGLVRGLAAGWRITLVCPGDPPPGVARHLPVALHGAGLAYPWRFDPAPLRAVLLRAGAHDRGLVWPGAEAAWLGIGLSGTGVHGRPPAVMDMIDCNPLEFWRTATAIPGAGSGWRTRARAVRELPPSLRWARRTVRGFTATACVGADDATWMARIGGRPVAIIPNGVDLPGRDEPRLGEPGTGGAAFRPPDPVPTAAFIGTLDYLPNMDAVTFLAHQVWPRIRAAVPGACLLVCGRRPGPAIQALHGVNGIEVLANVPSIPAVLSRAWVGLAPMRTGVGLKNKVLETWASARPCVLTPLAANGLALPPGHGGLLATDAAGLAAAAAALLGDRAACLRLGAAARDWVAERFSWASAAAAMDALLRQGS
jgi:glycosyltransferase involved in cell wall biosynthesis